MKGDLMIKQKKISFILFIFFIAYCSILASQEPEKEEEKFGWLNEIVGNLNLTQNQFDNWTKGGENSWSWQLGLHVKSVNNQTTFNWKNTGKISFGKTKVGKSESRKAADEIKLESVYTYKLGIFVNPYVSLMGQTQFTRGYEYTDNLKVEVSNFLDPGYFIQSIGISYTPYQKLQTRLGFAIKETFTKEHADKYAEGEKTKVEYGAESVTDLSASISKNILYTSKLELFSSLSRFNEIDINWDNIFSSKISEYVNVSFNFILFYDKDISKRRQIKQTLAAGLTYSFL
jgi:hypothetical protein